MGQLSHLFKQESDNSGAMQTALLAMMQKALERNEQEVSNRDVAEFVHAVVKASGAEISKYLKGMKDSMESGSGEMMEAVKRLEKALGTSSESSAKAGAEGQNALLSEIKAARKAIEGAVGKIKMPDVPKVDLEPIVEALEALTGREIPDHSPALASIQAKLEAPAKWAFDIERDDFSGRMTKVIATKLPPS